MSQIGISEIDSNVTWSELLWVPWVTNSHLTEYSSPQKYGLKSDFKSKSRLDSYKSAVHVYITYVLCRVTQLQQNINSSNYCVVVRCYELIVMHSWFKCLYKPHLVGNDHILLNNIPHTVKPALTVNLKSSLCLNGFCFLINCDVAIRAI